MPRLLRPDADGRQVPLVPDSNVTRSRRVRVRTRLLGGLSFSERRAPDPGSTVTLNLFDDARFVAVLEYVEPLGDGGYAWAGHLADRPDASVILTVRDGRIQASVNALQDGFYLLRATRDGAQLVVQIEGAPPPDAVEISPSDGVSVQPDDDRTTGSVQRTAQIDMLVVYTRAAQRSASNIHGVIDLAIAQTNNVLRRSGINGRLRLVQSAEVSYNEGGRSTRDVLKHLHEPLSRRRAFLLRLVALRRGFRSLLLLGRLSACALHGAPRHLGHLGELLGGARWRARRKIRHGAYFSADRATEVAEAQLGTG